MASAGTGSSLLGARAFCLPAAGSASRNPNPQRFPQGAALTLALLERVVTGGQLFAGDLQHPGHGCVRHPPASCGQGLAVGQPLHVVADSVSARVRHVCCDVSVGADQDHRIGVGFES